MKHFYYLVISYKLIITLMVSLNPLYISITIILLITIPDYYNYFFKTLFSQINPQFFSRAAITSIHIWSAKVLVYITPNWCLLNYLNSFQNVSSILQARVSTELRYHKNLMFHVKHQLYCL